MGFDVTRPGHHVGMAGSIDYDTMVMSVAGDTGGVCRRGDLLDVGRPVEDAA